MRLKRACEAICIGVVLTLLISFCGFTEQCKGISERVLRLHVIAASDTVRDQEIKLCVRDAILKETSGMLDGILNTDLAESILQDALPRIEHAAKDALVANGSTDTVHVELCDTYFTTREYDAFTLPAGEYRALRVVIGEGKGKNWWCVVFPPLCLSSVCENEFDDVLTDQQTAIVSDPSAYEVRFKLVEWYTQLRQWVQAKNAAVTSS